MTDYTKTTDFTSKDSLPSGDSGKIIRGAEFGTEFDNIQTAVNSKSNIDNPAFTGNITVTGTVDGRDIAADGTKLDTIETSADVTDTANVTAAGALMDSEVTNLAQVKAFDSADYATAAQGTTADNALPKTGGAMTGAITTNSTFDGRDVATDGTKLDTVETNADVTDTTNVTAAGALMDSELTDIASVKALNQGVATTDSPTFAGVTANGTVEFDGLSGTGAVTVTDILDQDDMSGNSATALATQQSIKAYVDSQVGTVDTLAEVLANGNATGGTDISLASSDITGTGDINITGDTTLTGSIKLPGDDKGVQFHTSLTGTEILADSSDNLTIKSLGNIVVNANDGEIKIKDGSSAFAGQIDLANDNNVTVSALISDRDLIFKGNDGGSTITALTLDMSDAGKALFNAGATFGSGIDVTGTVTADGLTVEQNDGSTLLLKSTDTALADGEVLGKVDFYGSDTSGEGAGVKARITATSVGGYGTATKLNFLTTDGASGLSNRMQIERNGDVQFFEDTGSTAKLEWLASAETLKFADNGKAVFGADSDLEIYHSTSHSIIADVGTGDLLLRGNNARLQNSDGSQTFVHGFNNGAVEISYSGTKKFETTVGGIDVTGTATMDGLVVEGNVTVGTQNVGSDKTLQFYGAGGSEHRINFADGVATDIFSVHYDGTDASPSNDLYIESVGNKLMKFDQNGDISFYDSTGTTPKFFWDASAESLRVPLSLYDNSVNAFPSEGYASVYSTGAGGSAPFNEAGHLVLQARSSGALRDILFATGNGAVERMRIDSAGRVGIGTDLPASPLTVMAADVSTVPAAGADSSHFAVGKNDQYGTMIGTLGSGAGYIQQQRFDGTATTYDLLVQPNGGNVGIGTSNPASNLHLTGAATGLTIEGTTRGDLFLIDSGAPTDQKRKTIRSFDGNLIFGTENDAINDFTEAMRLSSDGSVNITGPNSAIFSIQGGDGNSKNIVFKKTTGGAQQAKIQAVGDDLRFITGPGTDEAFRVDSSQNLLVGKTSAALGTEGVEARATGFIRATVDSADVLQLNRLSTDGDIIDFRKDGTTVGSLTADSGYLAIGKGDTGLLFQDGGDAIQPRSISGTANRDGAIDLGVAGGRFKDLYLSGGLRGDTTFKNNTGTTEYARFDSSGNVLVGQSTADSTSNGHGLLATGRAYHTMSSAHPLQLNRKSNDGDIAVFQKDGNTVGSVGVNNGTNFYIGSDGQTGLKFGSTDIVPADSNNSGASSDADMNLGSSSTRFKNLYLSGGAYLGGVAAANKLDDYEEGTWTPDLLNGTSITYNSRSGTYTKIGNVVHVTASIDVSNSDTSDGSGITIGGLPFNASNDTIIFTLGRYRSFLATKGAVVIGAVANSSFIQLFEGNNDFILYSEIGSSGVLHFSGTYRV